MEQLPSRHRAVKYNIGPKSCSLTLSCSASYSRLYRMVVLVVPIVLSFAPVWLPLRLFHENFAWLTLICHLAVPQLVTCSWTEHGRHSLCVLPTIRPLLSWLRLPSKASEIPFESWYARLLLWHWFDLAPHDGPIAYNRGTTSVSVVHFHMPTTEIAKFRNEDMNFHRHIQKKDNFC